MTCARTPPLTAREQLPNSALQSGAQMLSGVFAVLARERHEQVLAPHQAASSPKTIALFTEKKRDASAMAQPTEPSNGARQLDLKRSSEEALCADVDPPAHWEHSDCAGQKAAGKCDERISQQDYCLKTCGGFGTNVS